MVRIAGSHPAGPGSIPGAGTNPFASLSNEAIFFVINGKELIQKVFSRFGISTLIVFKTKSKKDMFSPGIEPGTFRVLGGCDNHYTTKTRYLLTPGS